LFTGRETRFKFVEKMFASASAVLLGSGSSGSAELIVNGCSGWSLLHMPYDRNPLSCVLRASLV